MIVAWMLYGLVVGALVAGAAALLAAVPAISRARSRWVWAGALALTVILVATAPPRAATPPPGGVDAAMVATAVEADAAGAGAAERASGVLAPLEGLGGLALAGVREGVGTLAGLVPPGAGRVAAWLWLALSLLVLLAFTAAGRRVRGAVRRWPGAEVQGVRVRVAPDAGPAVVGVSRPQIVVPRWLLSLPPDQQRLVLAHEREHQRARDPLLLGLGCAAAVLLPWHPAVWWMLARLRLAVELDCDARVLGRGASARAYGSLLIDLAGRCSGFRVGAPALAEGSSHLERRLIAMQKERSRIGRLGGGAAAAAALVFIVAACAADLPTTAEIEQMDVVAAEEGAQRLALPGTDGYDVAYILDGVAVDGEEARAVPADRIARIEWVRSEAARRAEMRITTKEAEARRRAEEAPDAGAETRAEEARRLAVAAARESAGAIEGAERPEGHTRVRVLGSPVVEPDTGFDGIVLIDGVRADRAAMRALEPSEIERIEILKGPAAAKLYPDDPAAAHGVIRVTTKPRP